MKFLQIYQEEVIPFKSGDGFDCHLIHVQGRTPPTMGPVLLVHGAGVRANIFRAPVPVNIVDYLITRGHDVWLENWRASIDLPFNHWNLDEAAVYDHPAAVDTVLRHTGADTLKAIVHCQGSTSFMFAAVAGLLPRVSVIVSNAVSLHTVIPEWSRFKMPAAVPILKQQTPYLDCQWPDHQDSAIARATVEAVRLTHHECDSIYCKMVSFVYGAGFPALWSHANLNDETHAWIHQEFGKVPITFFEQMLKCVHAGHLVPVSSLGLPNDFTARPPQTDARIALFAGLNNQCFLPESQQRTHEWLNSHAPNRHALHLVPHYGHLDIFIGKDSDKDVFPVIAQELETV
jgi:pimeloyl-ACP methyl ester carboxylesterase